MDENKDKKLLKKRFSCSWTFNWREIHRHQVFSLEEEGVLHRLQSYIKFRDNIIRDQQTSYPLNKENISKLLGRSVKQTSRILDMLELKNAIYHEKNGEKDLYVLNPCLFWRGTEKDKQYSELISYFNKRLDNMNCIKYCPYLVNVSGRRVSIFNVLDIFVQDKGHRCPRDRLICAKYLKSQEVIQKKLKESERKKQARESGLESQ